MGFIPVMFTLCPWIKYRKKDNEQWIPSGTQTTSPTEPCLIGRGAWGVTRPMALGRSLAGGLGNACLLTSACWLLRHFSQVVTVAQSLSLVQLLVTPWTAARQASLSLTNTRSPPKPMSIESVMPSNHLILCRPLLLLPSIFPSIRVFPKSQLFPSGGQSIGWSFSCSISPSSEHPGLVSFRMDWLDLLPVQGPL